MRGLFFSILCIGCIGGALAPHRLEENSATNATSVRQNPNGCSHPKEPSSPAEVVCAFYAFAEKGNLEKAMSYQTDVIPIPHGIAATGESTLVSVKPFHDSTRARQVYEELDRLVKIEDEIFDEERAEVLAYTTMLGGKGMTLTHFNLYKIEGKWKLGLVVSADNPICRQDPGLCYIVDRAAAKRLAAERLK
jgi:hypothetical protein